MNYDDMFFAQEEEEVEEPKQEQTSQRPDPANDTLVDKLAPVSDGNEDILRILVASDIHVGYGENKPNLWV